MNFTPDSIEGAEGNKRRQGKREMGKGYSCPGTSTLCQGPCESSLLLLHKIVRLLNLSPCQPAHATFPLGFLVVSDICHTARKENKKIQ